MHSQWQVPPAGSEIWRIQNASANITYDLSQSGSGWPDPTGAATVDAQGMPFQVLSVDGASLSGNGGSRSTGNQLLQNRVQLMLGSRVEILVTWRDPSNCKAATGALFPAVVPTRNSTIRLKTARYNTSSDAWPLIELAALRFTGHSATKQLKLLSVLYCQFTRTETVQDTIFFVQQLVFREHVSPLHNIHLQITIEAYSLKVINTSGSSWVESTNAVVIYVETIYIVKNRALRTNSILEGAASVIERSINPA